MGSLALAVVGMALIALDRAFAGAAWWRVALPLMIAMGLCPMLVALYRQLRARRDDASGDAVGR